MKLSFAVNCLILKNGKVGFSENATMIQIQNMFENGKPDIVLNTVESRALIQKNSYYNFDKK